MKNHIYIHINICIYVYKWKRFSLGFCCNGFCPEKTGWGGGGAGFAERHEFLSPFGS